MLTGFRGGDLSTLSGKRCLFETLDDSIIHSWCSVAAPADFLFCQDNSVPGLSAAYMVKGIMIGAVKG